MEVFLTFNSIKLPRLTKVLTKPMSRLIKLVTLTILTASLAGCAVSGSIQPVAKSKSGFEGALYSGETTVINAPSPGTEAFRVFNQGSTGFVSVEANREDAEHRARRFCEQRQQTLRPLQETVSKPPHVLGNFPRSELVFECVSKDFSISSSTARAKYEKLSVLKKLLDDGTLIQAEFASEKSKILSAP